MLRIRHLLLYSLICFLHLSIAAQNNRINTTNEAGWYNLFGTFSLTEKWGIHSEYQFRRVDVIDGWQQSLLRTGINYSVNPRVQLRLGYAWIETFPESTPDFISIGRSFTEHRIFEMIQLAHREGIIDLSHRFMLEQRFVGRYSTATVPKEDEYPLLHRARYLFRMQVPLKGKEISAKTPYAAFYDEVLVGFGKNVGANIFDQNRLGVLLGYRFSKGFRVEAGYLNQTLQFGRLYMGNPVFQTNHTLVMNAIFNVNL